MTICREQSLVKRMTNASVIHPLRCKCWHCEYCAEDRTKDLQGLARRGKPNRFLTLTIRPLPGESTDAAAERLYRAFRALRLRIKRDKGWKRLPFLAIFERHKSGMPHLHIMLRCGFISQSFLSDAMRAIVDSPIVDIRHVDDVGRVAYYVTKYITKAPARFEGCKRYWRSLDYELPELKYQKPEPDPNIWWMLSRARPEALLRLALLAGNQCTFSEGKWTVHGPPPELWQ